MKNGNGSNRVHILEMRARDVKSIRAVEINDVGDILEVRGDSGQGKTSILEAIEAGFVGMDPSMIRTGAERAEIELVLTEGRVNRLLRADGVETLVVTGKNGTNVKNAKAFLRTICDNNVFRPITWVKLGGGDAAGKTERRREQRKQLLAALPMTITDERVLQEVVDMGQAFMDELEAVNTDEIAFDAHALTVCAALEKVVYDYRRDQNRIADSAESELKLTPPPAKAPGPHDVAEYEKRLEYARQESYKAQAAGGRTEALRKNIGTLKLGILDDLPTRQQANATVLNADARISDLKSHISKLEAELQQVRKSLAGEEREKMRAEDELRRIDTNDARKVDLAAAEAELATSGAVVDLLTFERCVEQAHDDLTRRKQQDKHDAAVQKYTTAKERSDRLDGLVKLFRDVLPKKLIEEARLPVPGLRVDAEQIYVNDVPLHQLGTSEQIRVGVAIAGSLNPNCGFVLIDQAESLGTKDRVALREIAREMGLQLIMTYVDADAQPGPGVVVMHEGERVGA